uniref:BICRA like chromatin remodeling complex associated protein n=1 Tax=Nothobranchius furzeri TaxID=105023 RepID=A0A8C6W141_NOTFU
MGEFGEDSSGAGLQLSSSLSFIEDELGAGSSPEGVDLGGEDQHFDILQKSLMEADITEQTLAQEALLDSQPAPTLVQAPVPFSSQLVSGSYGGGVGVVTTTSAAIPAGQLLQGMPPLPNGSTQHIQVLGSFGTGGGVMTLSSLERTPQIVLRPGLPVASAGATTGGQVFASNQGQVGQVGLPFKNIPLQNIIIQRGPGGTQAIVRPIQPKPPLAGSQTVYNLGVQPSPTSMANVNTNTTAPVGQYTANGTIVVQPPLEQQQVPAQTNLPAGQFLLPNSLTLTPSTAIHNGTTNPCSSALITNQNTMQIAAPAGQLILNQGMASGGQVVGDVTPTWTGVSCASTTPVQTCTPGRLTLVGPATAGIGGHQASGCHVQRLLVTQTQNCTSLSPLPGNVTQEQGDFRQQLRKDHTGVQTPDRRKFASVDDALQRLLSYHLFQGAPPNQDEFSQVDEEFEVVATQVLNKTQAMVDKYRRLLMVDAERSSPSSEMVMIDRTFNQEERGCLTQDKRMVLVDPDSFLEDFCCGPKSRRFHEPVPSEPVNTDSWDELDQGSVEPAYRTDSQLGCGDPGGGVDVGERLHSSHSENKTVSELKRTQPLSWSSGAGNNSFTAKGYSQGKPAHFAAAPAGQAHYQTSHHLSCSPTQPQHSPGLTSPPPPDTDSALEAAVNSILEC